MASWTSKASSGCESAHVRRKKTSSSRCSGSASSVVLDDHDAAALTDCLSRVAKDGDEVVHELRRSQSDFLRHPPLIASGAGSEHSPKAGPRYLSGRFRRR